MYVVIKTAIEKFKDITYPGIKKNMYMVSNYGNILNKKTGILKNIKPSKRGYMSAKLRTEIKGSKLYYVHRLVAWEFVPGYGIDGKIDVNHLDTNRSNNYFENLEWCTPSENNFHRYYHGNGFVNLVKPPISIGENHPRNIYDSETIKRICGLIKEGKTNSEIMNNFGYKGQNDNKKIYSLIYDIRNKRAWAHISKNFF